MKKEFKLKLRQHFSEGACYYIANTPILCHNDLRNYFNFPSKQPFIVGILSDEPMKNSYKLQLKDGYSIYNKEVFIERERKNHTFTEFDELVYKHFPEGCYARIEWEES